MKRLNYLLCIMWLVSGEGAIAGITVKTSTGAVYKNAEVKKVKANIVELTHEGGVTSVPIVELSKDTRLLLKMKLTPVLVKADFDNQINKFKAEVFRLNVTYSGYLSKLEKESKDQGLLEQLLAVRKEIADFTKGIRPEDIKYPKLKKLRSIYEDAIQGQRTQITNNLKPVLRGYLKELAEIQKTLLLAEKIEEAGVVDKEQDRIKSLISDPNTALFALDILPDAFSVVIAKKQSPSTPKKATAPVAKKDVPVKDIASTIVGGEYKIYRSSEFIVSLAFDANGKVKAISNNGKEFSHPWKITDGVLQYFFHYSKWVDVEIKKGGDELSFEAPDTKNKIRYRR